MRCALVKGSQSRRVALPPVSELRAQAKILREVAGDDPHVIAVCDAFEAVDGYLRVGGPDEPKRAPLLPEGKGREPPER
jgi:hypothetical protein